MNILEAIEDLSLFAPWFRRPADWAAWFAFLAALFALPMTAEQLAIYQECTGRTAPPSRPSVEAWLICGRRAGKSFVLALVAVFLAVFKDYAPFLAPGERATILVIGADRRQARVIMRYVRALLTGVEMFAGMIERETAESFDLSNRVTIEVCTASYRTSRGYTLAAALADELAFWAQEDAAQPDYEVLDALRPGMATIPGAMLLCASSPYGRRGALWDAWKRHYGREGHALVWKAPTRRMNPSVPQSLIDAAYERDESSASAEYGANFRTDVAALLTREAVEACVDSGVAERPRIDGVHYAAFLDPSGGSSDSFCLAIGHKEGDAAVIDCLREIRPPFSPELATSELAEVLKSFGLRSAVSDRFGGIWPKERFAQHGIEVSTAAKPKSELYGAMVAVVNSGRLALLDNPRLIAQLVGLERRTARGGRDSIAEPPGGHDDLSNVVAGVCHSLLVRPVFDGLDAAPVGPVLFSRRLLDPGYEDAHGDVASIGAF